MKRRLIEPWQFGSNTPPAWAGDDAPQQMFAHYDYCVTYRERSFRLWEPGRESYSSAGVYGDSGAEVAPELPLVATLHGIKGHIDLSFGMKIEDLGRAYDDSGTPINIENGLATETFIRPGDMWEALTGEHFDGVGMPNTVLDWQDSAAAAMRLAPQVRIPMFFCLYRGTYKQIDANAGWEIDTGPEDDADTLLSMDITNPSVLESSRIDWWAMEMYPLPRSTLTYNYISDPPRMEPTVTSDSKGGLHRYSMNLDANKTLGPDQVLWLHVKSGTIRLPVMVTPPQSEGGPLVQCVYYTDHQFSAHIHASALVTTRLRTS